MSEKLLVTETTELLPFLHLLLSTWARNKIKQRLQAGCVSVNGISITQHNYTLNIGDKVEVGATVKTSTQPIHQLTVLYCDKQLIAINKPAGLLSVATTKENQQHALAILRKQLSSRDKSIKLWPVHRIDRDTSGVLLFATSREIRESVMAQWHNTEKTYLAIVVGCPNPAQGSINQPLRLDEVEYRMHVGEHPNAKLAITHFKTEQSTATRSLLKVQLETGRQHQIRAHLSWLGHPIVGDERYGTAGVRMGLHALGLRIPKNRKEISIEAPAPADFLALMRK